MCSILQLKRFVETLLLSPVAALRAAVAAHISVVKPYDV